MNRDRIAAVIIVAVGAALRLCWLALVPFHHDEGVNGWFVVRMYKNWHDYKYDPANYHGPSLYYFTWPLTKIFGLHPEVLRVVPAIFGIGVLVLLIVLGRRLGGASGLYAAALVAVSPGMVYISRYFIHEMMVVFFTLGIVVAAELYNERPTLLRFYAAIVSAAFFFTTKETFLPSIITLGTAFWLTIWVMRWTRLQAAARDTGGRRRSARRRAAVRESAGKTRADADIVVRETDSGADDSVMPHQRWDIVLWGAVIFEAIGVVLYTSLFQNRPGFFDAFRSLTFWSSTGVSAHEHPKTQFLSWMFEEEGAILFLGLAGIAYALFKRKNALSVFCAFWSLGMFSMYSLIPYKTPWLGVNIILPFAIMAGFLIEELCQTVGVVAGMVLLFVSLQLGLIQCFSLNFKHYDDDRYAYVYAHTVRSMRDMLAAVDQQAGHFKGKDTKIAIVAENYWPLPWELRDYSQAAFFGRMADLSDYAMVVAESKQAQDIVGIQFMTNAATLSQRGAKAPPFTLVGTYTLRPGVDLQLYVRSAPDKQ